MSNHTRGPLILAAAQVIVAGGLLYWDHLQYTQALARMNAISLWDHWSLPGGFLLIFDFPALILTFVMVWILPESEALQDVIFLGAVFVTWGWLGSLLYRNVGKVTTRQRLTNIAGLVGCLLVAAASPIAMSGLMVSWTLKAFVVGFWTCIALVAVLQFIVHGQKHKEGPVTNG